MKPSTHKARLGIIAGVLLAALVFLPGTRVSAAGWHDVEQARDAIDSRQYEEAVRLATRAITSGKLKGLRLARAHQTRGGALAYMKRLKAAGVDFTKAIRLIDQLIRSGAYSGEDLAYAYNTRGISQEAMGRAAEAIADYSAAVEVLPGFFNSYLNRGNAYFTLKRYALAVADYGAAIKAKPDNSKAYYARARALVRHGDYGKAIADYDHALAINPEHPLRWLYHLGRGNAYFLTEDFAQAIADYEASLALNPDFSLTNKNLPLARKALRRTVTAKGPSDQELWDSLAFKGDEWQLPPSPEGK